MGETATKRDSALVIDGSRIRRDGEMWCLTDLWRAAGKPKLTPAEWLRTDAAKMFVEFIEDSLNVVGAHVEKRRAIRIVRGGTDPATWAHWQIALAYAKALSPAFHARVNEVYRAFVSGQHQPALPSADHDELIRLSLRLNALENGRASVWDYELKQELCRLRNLKWDGQAPEPQPLAFAYGKTWRIILGNTVYDELKRRNPHPRSGSLNWQWLQDKRYELVKDVDMIRVLDTARGCMSWADYVHRLGFVFRRGPLQLEFERSRKKLPPGEAA